MRLESLLGYEKMKDVSRLYKKSGQEIDELKKKVVDLQYRLKVRRD
jgi:hypothetical protein